MLPLVLHKIEESISHHIFNFHFILRHLPDSQLWSVLANCTGELISAMAAHSSGKLPFNSMLVMIFALSAAVKRLVMS